MTVCPRKLGQSDLGLSPLGLGVMQFAEGRGGLKGVFPTVPDKEREQIVREALAGGINWFEVAGLSGGEGGERNLAEALKKAGGDQHQVVIAASWSPFLRSAGSLAGEISAAQRDLDPFTIGLLQIPRRWSFSTLETQLNVLADLVDQGLIRGVGVKGFSAGEMRRAQALLARRGIPLASNQVPYNLLNRKIEMDGVLDTARELGAAIIASAPLASGVLTGKFHSHPEILEGIPTVRRRRLESQLESSRLVVDTLEQVAASYGSEPARVALSWLIHQGRDVFALPGASRVEHIRESQGALELELSPDDLSRLNEATRKFR